MLLFQERSEVLQSVRAHMCQELIFNPFPFLSPCDCGKNEGLEMIGTK